MRFNALCCKSTAQSFESGITSLKNSCPLPRCSRCGLKRIQLQNFMGCIIQKTRFFQHSCICVSSSDNHIPVCDIITNLENNSFRENHGGTYALVTPWSLGKSLRRQSPCNVKQLWPQRRDKMMEPSECEVVKFLITPNPNVLPSTLQKLLQVLLTQVFGCVLSCSSGAPKKITLCAIVARPARLAL